MVTTLAIINAFKSLSAFPCKSGSVYSPSLLSKKLSRQEGCSDSEVSVDTISG